MDRNIKLDSTPETASVTINDNDITVSIQPPDDEIIEGTTASFTVRLAVAPTAPVTVNLRVSEDEGSDFVRDSIENTTQSVVIEAEQTVATLVIPTDDDDEDEPHGTITVEIIEPMDPNHYRVNPALASASVFVYNDDTTVSIESESAGKAIVEGNQVEFKIRLSSTLFSAMEVKIKVSESDRADIATGFIAAKDKKDPIRIVIPRGTAELVSRISTLDNGNTDPDGTVTVSIVDPESPGDYKVGEPNSFSFTVFDNRCDSRPRHADVDRDDDGLIELCYLEDLNAIRYQLDGSGYQARVRSAKNTNGCDEDGAEVCKGYELIRDLNFNDNLSYRDIGNKAKWTSTSRVGWQPIGSVSDPFAAIFEGNGYAISGLRINRAAASDIGLFGSIGSTSNIRNVNVEGTVIGNESVGTLAGQNFGTIRNSNATANISGINAIGGLVGKNDGGKIFDSRVTTGSVVGQDNVGGLAGENAINSQIINSYVSSISVNSTSTGDNSSMGGLVGSNLGSIANSYAITIRLRQRPNVQNRVGGLVGHNNGGSITNTYAGGSVMGYGGGLVGRIEGGSTITNSYAYTEGVSINAGLIQENTGINTITNSYWDTDTSEQEGSAGGIGKTTVELQTPKMATGIYEMWSPDDWDFGDERSYPVIRYAAGDDGDACDLEFAMVSRCGNLLLGQPDRDKGLSAVFFKADGKAQDNSIVFGRRPFSSLIFDYIARFPNTATAIQLMPYAASNSTMTISIFKDEEYDKNYFENKLSGNLSDSIPVQAGVPTLIELVVGDVDPTTYSFVRLVSLVNIKNIRSTPVSGSIVNERDAVTLSAEVGDGVRRYEYTLRHSQGNKVIARSSERLDALSFDLSFNIPGDVVDPAYTRQSIVFTLTLDDGFVTASEDITFIVIRENDGEPQLELSISPEVLRINHIAEDPDGVGTFTYQWQERYAGLNSWRDISTNSNSYTVPTNASSTIRYRVKVDHTDPQGNRKDYPMIGPFPVTADADGNGLIDIYYLEDLNVVRATTDGSAYRITPPPTEIAVNDITAGCPEDGCNGYELKRNLDFATTQSYVDVQANRSKWTVDDFDDNADDGWDPIGKAVVVDFVPQCDQAGSNCFASTFAGNGFTIANLQINRNADNQALFAAIDNGSEVRDLNLRAVKIKSTSNNIGSLVGNNIGSLAGRNQGDISNTSVAGEIRGMTRVGGLVGDNRAEGNIRDSSATGEINGRNAVGGLVGAHRGNIIGSSAASRINGGVSLCRRSRWQFCRRCSHE